MKIVVTGALGHIGSRLIRALPPAFPGVDLLLLDNLATQRYSSLFSLPQARYRFIELDVLQGNLEDVFAGAQAVVHLAALTDPGASFGKPEEMERVNYTATSRVAHACAAAGCALFHVSSTSVYGGSATSVDENSREYLRPQSPYAETKLREEDLLAELGKARGLRFTVCRFGTICGISPGMRFHTAVNRFCWQAARGEPLTVWRTAMNQKRPYLDLSEAVEAIIFVLRRDLFDGQVYNVLTGNLVVGAVLNMIRPHVPNMRVRLVDSPIMNEFSYDVLDGKLRQTDFAFRGDIPACVEQTLALLKGLHAG